MCAVICVAVPFLQLTKATKTMMITASNLLIIFMSDVLEYLVLFNSQTSKDRLFKN